jgi:hypothetical protein
MTIRLARRNELANTSATREGRDGFPLSRELKTSAAKMVSDRSSGAVRTSQPDFSVSPAMYVETRIPAAISRLGVRSSQYFRVMLSLLYLLGTTKKGPIGDLEAEIEAVGRVWSTFLYDK